VNALWRPIPLPIKIPWESPLTTAVGLALTIAIGLALAFLPLQLALILVLGTAVGLVMLIEPLLGLALTLLAGPFGALESIVLGGTSFDSGQLLLLISLTIWLAHRVARREIRLPQVSRLVLIPLLAFLAAAGLSLLNANSPIDGIKEFAKWVQIGLLAWLVMDAVNTAGPERAKKRLLGVAAAVLLAGLSQALIGIWQFGLRGHGPEHFLVLCRFYRAYGSFEQPNPYAGFLGLTLPLAIGLGIGVLGRWATEQATNGARWRKSLKQLALNPVLWLAGVAATVLGTALLMSWSRGGWLGAAAGATAMLFFLPRKRWQGAVLVLALLAAGLLALQMGLVPASIAGRLTDFGDYVKFQDVRGVAITPGNYAVMERLAHWQAALNMANAHPWLGVGFGNYEAAYANYSLINWPYALGHAHNYYLNLLAETGILGLLSYLGFWAAVLWLTIRTLGRLAYPQRGLVLGLMGIWVHLSVHHLVDKLYVNNIYLHLGVLLGILLILNQASKTYDRTHR